MARKVAVANSRQVNAQSAFVRKRDAAVRKSFDSHLSRLRKQATELTIQMMDELAVSDSLSDELIHRAICAHGVGAANIDEYLGEDSWVYMFNHLFDFTFCVDDWIDFFEVDYTQSRRLMRQQAIGFVEGLALWWDAVGKAAEGSEKPQPRKPARRQLVAA